MQSRCTRRQISHRQRGTTAIRQRASGIRPGTITAEKNSLNAWGARVRLGGLLDF